MRTLESLNLIVPKLGIDSTKRITGGRDWNGYLQPSICYGDNNNNSGPSWDSWYNDYLYDHADPDYGANSGVGGAPDYNGSGSSGSDYDDDLSNITFEDNIDDSVKEQIQKFIQSLPEELLHVWQYNNCLDGESKMSNADRSAMEFQAAIVEYIYNVYFSTEISATTTLGISMITDEISRLYSDGIQDIKDFFNDITSMQWEMYYTEWEEEMLIGGINKDTYDWNWDLLINMFLSYNDSTNIPTTSY